MKKKLSGRGLVIQLTEEQMRIAQMPLGAAMPQINSRAVVDLPAGAVEDGVIRQPEAVRTLLQAALNAPEFKRARQVVFSLCTTQVIAERVSVPAREAKNPKRLERLLLANMDMYFPVDTMDYHLVWQTAGPVGDGGETAVQLWAVPKAVLVRYYALANDCGLNVAAVDYGGNSMVSAAEASYGASAAREKKAPRRRKDDLSPTQAEAPSGDTTLYLTAEPGQLMTTFVRDGQVRLQRSIQCAMETEAMVGELQMVADYFDTTDDARGSMSVAACGSLASDGAFLDAVRAGMNVPVRPMSVQSGPEWALILGASRTGLDFGLPTMNHVSWASEQLGQAWQYVLVAAGGAALLAALVVNFGSRVVWDTTLSGLRSTQQTLQLQAAQNAGNANRYQEYESLYDSYSSDWETLFDSLRTYNDNLGLILDELEELMPESASALHALINDEGMWLQFVCPDKETAAYLIKSMRDMKYASLSYISDLSIGPPGAKGSNYSGPEIPWGSYGREAPLVSIPQSDDSSDTAETEAPPTEGGTEFDVASLVRIMEEAAQTEAPPTEGSEDFDISALAQIMQQALAASGASSGSNLSSAELSALLQQALNNRTFTQADIEAAMDSLTEEQRLALLQEYCTVPSVDYEYDYLIKRATVKERETALRTMFTKDLAADYLFYQLFEEDMHRKSKDMLLYVYIVDDLVQNRTLMDAVQKRDLTSARKALPELVDILTKDEKTIGHTEDLILTSPDLSKRAAYYLAVAMGRVKEDASAGSLDTERLIKDLMGGSSSGESGGSSGSSSGGRSKPGVNSALGALTSALTGNTGTSSGGSTTTTNPAGTATDNNALLQALIPYLMSGMNNGANTGNSGNSALNSLLSQLPGGSVYGGGAAEEPAEPDTRIYFMVTLNYKDELIQAELERKGLSRGDKAAKLEVAE